MKKRYLKQALRQNQFYPVYQPVWDEANRNFCGAEVLIRWEAKTFNKIIMPDIFIPEAEKTKLIVPITLQLIKKAFQESHKLLHKKPQFYLSFNLSPTHFEDPVFFTEFYSLCSKFNIPPHQIMLELTEIGLFNQNNEKIFNIMSKLRAEGYSLAIDDFGTGQANINYLHHFPFNYLKIDKLFISAIGTGAIIETLNKAIITMANSLKLHVIAEGVETKTQLDYLQKNQVNYIQGWFYATAMPYQEFVKFILTYEN